MTNNVSTNTLDHWINPTTGHAIESLERMEGVTFSNLQREAIRLLIQDEGRHVEIRMPRRSGKTFLCRILAKRLGNDVGIVVPNHRMKDLYAGWGIDDRRIFSYGELVSLIERGAPEIILCDECRADDFIQGFSRTKKILSIYTTDMIEIERRPREYFDPIMPHDELWSQEYNIQKEKEWDDESN